MRSERRIIFDFQANVVDRFAVTAVVRSIVERFLVQKSFATSVNHPEAKMSFEVEKRKANDHFIYFDSYVKTDVVDRSIRSRTSICKLYRSKIEQTLDCCRLFVLLVVTIGNTTTRNVVDYH